MASLNVMTLPGKRMPITVPLVVSMSATIFLRSLLDFSLDVAKSICLGPYAPLTRDPMAPHAVHANTCVYRPQLQRPHMHV